MLLVPPPRHARLLNTKIIDELRNLSLTSGLVLCLDAGDSASYDGTSQTWNDVSGNGNNFYRGSGSGSDGADPTFHGTANARSSSEYFSGDGGDAFWQTGSQTFMNGWHKDGATFTVAAWVWLTPGGAQGPNLLRNFRDITDIGIAVLVSPIANAGKVGTIVVNGSGQQNMLGPTVLVVEGEWIFVALSFSEGSGTSFTQVKATQELLSSDTYSSPSASNATNGNSVWAAPDTAGTALELGSAPSSGCRTNSLIAWSRALSQAETLALYNATKSKFGL